MANNKTIKPLAITMGEPSGIGPDCLLKIAAQKEGLPYPAIIFADPDFLKQRAKYLNLNVTIKPLKNKDSPSYYAPNTLYVMPLGTIVKHNPGKIEAINSVSVTRSIEMGLQAVKSTLCSALVTAPLHKRALYDQGFTFQGHTDYLEHLAEELWLEKYKSVMMLASSTLRTVPITIHIPLKKVSETLSQKLIIETAHIVYHDLKQRFNIANPHIAFTGLNPHAGEEGMMGFEEIEIIEPALKKLKKEGLRISGPWPADTLFHQSAREEYDVALCMYHDQALIPLKTIGFDEGVNVTLGLPFIRTSPDHGTALERAGTGNIKIVSFMNALAMAYDMACKTATYQTP